MESPHSDKLDRSVCHPDRKVGTTNSSDGDFLGRSVHFPTIAKHKNTPCNRPKNRNKSRISKSTEVQPIKENEEFTMNYSRHSGNQDVRKKEHIEQTGQTSLEKSSDCLSPTTSSARTTSFHVNQPPTSPDKNPPISSADVYHFSTDPERNENNRDNFIPKQLTESSSNIRDSADNQDVLTKEPLQQKGQSSSENGSDFLPPTTSSDLKTTATISAPSASPDVNPSTTSPDIIPTSAGSYISQQFKGSTQFIIGFAAGCFGLFIFKKFHF